MELRVLLLLPLCFPGLWAQTPAAEERRWEGGVLHIQCPYPGQPLVKAWCRMTGEQCEHLVRTMPSWYLHRNPATNGEITINNDYSLGIVSITMTKLQTEDSGTYACVYRPTERGKDVTLKTISLNVLKELQRWELDSVSVECKYSASAISTSKGWCRRGQNGCKTWLKTNYPSTRSSSKVLGDRVVMEDVTQRRTLTITMQKLQARDTATYWCALYTDSQPTRLMEVRLSVSKKRVTIQDDKVQGIVTVTMRELQAEDAGVYWCALYEDGQLFRMTEVTLSIPSSDFSSNGNTFILLSGVLSILFLLALSSSITLYVLWRKQGKSRGNREAEDTYDKPENVAQLSSTERMESPKDDSNDLKYAALNFTSQRSSEDTLYCNVEPSQADRKAKDESVDYAVIALKHLPMNNKG
ncbi:PREDICTED: CMRF35-like molecule 1 [Merops nubicus]|uniref:CMRF35-like molecule 1 n=1 Tax=Merops nubicus TaxID=57421 RepID=UPI0004F0A203|nr:PREDICTED: CMRF35-like molecule 1 [Merops nubicus]